MRKMMRRAIPTVALVFAIGAMGIPTALAGGPTTDLLIGKYLVEEDLVIDAVGNGTYNGDPSVQQKTVRVKPGKRATFALLVQNDGGSGTILCGADAFPQSAKFKGKVLSDTDTDVTAAWIADTISLPLNATAGEWYYPSVKVSKNAKPGTSRVYEFRCTAAVSITTDTASMRVVVR